MSTDKEKRDQFEWWITCIPDKIEYLKKHLPKDIGNKLDFSKESLKILGAYIIKNFAVERIEEDKELWDAVASYIGQTYKKHFSNAYWHLELEDKSNVDYNKPKVLHKDIPVLGFDPHRYVMVLLGKNNESLWAERIDKNILYINDFIKKYKS